MSGSSSSQTMFEVIAGPTRLWTRRSGSARSENLARRLLRKRSTRRARYFRNSKKKRLPTYTRSICYLPRFPLRLWNCQRTLIMIVANGLIPALPLPLGSATAKPTVPNVRPPSIYRLTRASESREAS